MIIELTKCEGEKKIYVDSVGLNMEPDKTEGVEFTWVVFKEHSRGSTSYGVKETPAQIQEMILLDEFARVALGGLCEWGEDIEDMAKGAYQIAKAMIEARKEVLRCTV